MEIVWHGASDVVASPRRDGTVGRGELAARASKFAAGKWSELIEEACQCETQVNQTRKWFIVQKKRGEAGLPRVACNKDKCPGLVRS